MNWKKKRINLLFKFKKSDASFEAFILGTLKRPLRLRFYKDQDREIRKILVRQMFEGWKQSLSAMTENYDELIGVIVQKKPTLKNGSKKKSKAL